MARYRDDDKHKPTKKEKKRRRTERPVTWSEQSFVSTCHGFSSFCYDMHDGVEESGKYRKTGEL